MTAHSATNGATVHPCKTLPGAYVQVDDTTWPVDGGDDGASVQWGLRYAVDTPTTRGEELFIASCLSAYEYLTTPSITQGDAFASLKRARKARAAAEAQRPPMTPELADDNQEAQAHRHALHAATLARNAADAYDSGRIGDSMEMIRQAATLAHDATQRAWPFLNGTETP